MSDKSSSTRPAANPFFDDVGGSRPPPRARRQKPPPGIITAGGVDMARAHASGIKIREAPAPVIVPDEPRVVIAVETDERKVPTHPRLLEGRDGDARAALLPATPDDATIASVRRARPERAPSRPPAPSAVSTFARGALALVMLLVGFGAAYQYRSLAEPVRLAPRVTAMLHALPQPILPPPPPAPIALAASPSVDAEPPLMEEEPASRAPTPRPRRAPAPPRPSKAPVVAAQPASPASDSLPPFQLPAEKKHD